MLQKSFTYLLSILLFGSCQEVNINRELNNSAVLDSVLQEQYRSFELIDSLQVLEYSDKVRHRISMLKSPLLSDFQKQWLHYEQLGYEKVELDLLQMNHIMDSIKGEYSFSRKQILNLQEDLIHRQLSKEQFQIYFTQEQKAIANLTLKSGDLQKRYHSAIRTFDSLDLKLKSVLQQLDSLSAK